MALILSPNLATLEFLETIVQELRCPAPIKQTVKAPIDALNMQLMHAHAEASRVVLIVDEAPDPVPRAARASPPLDEALETAKQKNCSWWWSGKFRGAAPNAR